MTKLIAAIRLTAESILLGMLGFAFLCMCALFGFAAASHAAEGDLRDIKLGLGATQYQLLTPFPAPGTQCIRYMDGADGSTLGKFVGCWKLGTGLTITGGDTLNAAGSPGPQGATGSIGPQGVAGPTGAPGATGAQGIAGATGATGSQGIAGDLGPQGPQGATGSTGSTGAQGIQGIQGATGATGPAGTTTWAGITDKPLMQRTRVQTASNGTYTWTFPTAYPGGTVPVVTLAPETDGAMSVTAISNTAVSVKLVQLVDVTVLGIHVLAAGASSAQYIHITAITP